MRHAFSLVELSIVLVILGLLTGGILAGQSLIRAAEMRAVSTEYSKYLTASRAFRDKYFAIPGDMNNAISFWSADAGGCPGNNTTTTAPGVTTCNGDGNGQISRFATTSNEPYRFWQHLANAGLIEGSFTGVADSATATNPNMSITTPNVPKSRLSNSYWYIQYQGPQTIASAAWFEGDLGNPLILSSTSNMTGAPAGAILRPEEAWNIDTKLDDGKPGTGVVQSPKTVSYAIGTGTGCSDTAYTTISSIASVSAYQLNNANLACVLVFKTGY